MKSEVKNGFWIVFFAMLAVSAGIATYEHYRPARPQPTLDARITKLAESQASLAQALLDTLEVIEAQGKQIEAIQLQQQQSRRIENLVDRCLPSQLERNGGTGLELSVKPHRWADGEIQVPRTDCHHETTKWLTVTRVPTAQN